MSDQMHFVRFVHEPVHERLINWSRWLKTSRGGTSTTPMFRHYKAPRYRNALDEIHIPVDTLDAIAVERVVCQLPEKHRDATRWFYVFSRCGFHVWRACRELAVTRDGLSDLVHDSRGMLKIRLDRSNFRAYIMPAITVDPASAASASRREAEATGIEA